MRKTVIILSILALITSSNCGQTPKSQGKVASTKTITEEFPLQASERNPDKIEYSQINDIIKDYPAINYIGAFGKSDMRPMHNNALRDFGIYRKAKIKIVPTTQINNEIVVIGRLFIFDYLKEDFTGKITISQINDTYSPNNKLNERGDLIKDSTLINEIKGDFIFNFDDIKEYKGSISIIIRRNKENEWILDKSGIVLYGNLDNSSLNFGHITPPSSGIFRFQYNNDKMSINKNLLKYGWQSYLYSYPEYFDSVFDSFSDETEKITIETSIVNKNREIENDELKL